MNFDKAFEILIGHEGGYVNDPADPGGETKYGISKRSYPDVDIKNLTLAEAKVIYYQDFWVKAHCDEMPPLVAFNVFDAAVNHGRGQAIRFLQRALNVVDDGVFGNVTRRALFIVVEERVVMAFNAERLHFFTQLSTWGRFGKGWSRRIAENLKVFS